MTSALWDMSLFSHFFYKTQIMWDMSKLYLCSFSNFFLEKKNKKKILAALTLTGLPVKNSIDSHHYIILNSLHDQP